MKKNGYVSYLIRLIVLAFLGLVFYTGFVTAHTGGNTTSTNQNFIILFILGIMISLIPFVVGVLLYFPIRDNHIFERHMIKFYGLSIGILLFLFYDYLSLSSFLGIRSTSVVIQILILMTFVATIFLFTKLSTAHNHTTNLVYLWAVGIGIHSLAEGIIMGHNFQLGINSILLPLPALSFAMHKFAEGFTITGLLFIVRTPDVFYDSDNIDGKVNNDEKQLSSPGPFDYSNWTIILLIAISVLPTLFGILLGFYNDAINLPNLTTRLQSFLYTISLGVVLFILPYFFPSISNDTKVMKTKITLWVILGFLFLYLSVYFHEI